MWAVWSAGEVGLHDNVEGMSGTEKGTQGPYVRRGLYSDRLFAGASEFLQRHYILMGQVCLISQGRFLVPVCPLGGVIYLHLVACVRRPSYVYSQRFKTTQRQRVRNLARNGPYTTLHNTRSRVTSYLLQRVSKKGAN